jgi:phage terminase large subunit-like protein
MLKEWSTSCPDWTRRIVAQRSLITFKPLFQGEADAALAVFRDLKIVDAPGSPTFGEACEPWVFEFVGAIFGAADPDTGKRLIREFFLCIAKKNSKSTIAAGIMLTALIINWRLSAELLILAPTIEVADNSFKPAADMVHADPELDALLHVQDHVRTITHRTTKAFLKVVAADSDTVSGKKASFVLVDELWAFGKKPKADAMLREATGGLVSRPEGFVIYLSTQSDEPPSGVFKAKLDYFRDVRDGKIKDNKSLGVLYEFPPAMVAAEDYLKPENFYITNPNLGRSVSQEWLEDELTKEVGSGGRETMATFLAKHLNVEIGMNLRSNRWAGADYWERRADTSITLGSLIERCEVIVPGIDGGGLDDLFGLTVVGREPGDVDVVVMEGGERVTKSQKRWLSWSHAWCHVGVLDRRKSIAARLRDFEKAGELTIVDDELGDVSEIVAIIDRIKTSGKLATVAVDPAGLGEFVDALAEIGVTEESGELKGASQGYAMMNAIKTAERKLANGTLKHSGSALMAWCVGNLKIEPTATAIRATKQNAGDAKIDPVMALFDAVTFMALNPEPAGGGPSHYETHDLLMV